MASINGTKTGNATTSGASTLVLRYDVPHYRMRSLCRRLDALSSACSVRGIEFKYEIRRGVQLQHADMIDETGRRRGFSHTFDAPRFLMDHVLLHDGIKADPFRIVAIIDRHAGRVRPLSRDDEIGNALADEWWCQEMEAHPGRYEKYLGAEGCRDILDEFSQASFADAEDATESHGMSEALVTGVATCSICDGTAKNGKTYLVMDERSEELLQIGGCCISKYANGLPARYVLRYAEVLSQMALHSSPAGLATLPFAANAVPANLIVAAAMCDIEECGYTRWRDAGTSCTWWQAMWAARNGIERGSQGLPAGVENRLNEADQAIEWARQGFPGIPSGDWLNSLTEAISTACEGYVECRIADKIASIATLWHRNQAYCHIKSRSIWIAPSGSTWVGEPNERFQKRIVHIENMMRTQVNSPIGLQGRDLNALLTDEGDVLIWRTTLDLSNIATKISQESPVMLDATVLKHREYLGMRETIVTRGRLRWPDGRSVMAEKIRHIA